MPNHVHLVLACTRQALSDGCRRLNGVHAQRFNRKYERWGHLWGDRFSSRLITTDEYLTEAVDYVLDNPVRAGLVRHRDDYRWSGVRPTRSRAWTNTRSTDTLPPRMAADELVVHGAREHNLKDITVRLPRNRLICITGLSGSGKSSLAFDTIYAEGQRRYVESLSAYARQFLQMMEKPDVDHIDGLSPAISIDQKTTSRNPRSTVGTVTEIYDYLRLLYARIGRPHCPVCGRPIAGQSLEAIVDQILQLPEGTRFTVNAPVVRDRKGEYRDLLEELRREGFTRVKVDGEQRLLEEEIPLDKKFKHTIHVVVDRLVMKADLRTRLAQSVETAAAPRGGPRRDRRRRRRGAALLRELRLPRARRLAPRAAAAHLLLQQPARRLPALHGPRRAAGDRPGPARPRPVALDRRGRARPVVGRQLELLRVGHPGRRRALRDRPRHAVARADRGAAEPLPPRHGRRARLRHLPQPHGPAAGVHARVRGDRREPRSAATGRPTRRRSASGSRST